MGICDFPRIHFKGLLDINVGTANNDDYSSDVFPPGHPHAGELLRLADSIHVQPRRFGMTDEEWVAWAQALHTFVPEAPTTPANKSERISTETSSFSEDVQLIPAEWNYYGDMGLAMRDVTVVATRRTGTAVDDSEQDPMIGATLSFNNRPGPTGRSTGLMIDLNPESVPCTQIFADALTLEKDGKAFLNAKPTKACTRWINFQRNTDLGGPNGAAGTFYCAVPLSAIEQQPIAEFMREIPPPKGKVLAGIQIRYVMYRAFQPINVYKYPGDQWAAEMVKLYADKGMNPDICELQGTIGPWYEGEFESSPIGRQLNPTGNTFPIPAGSRGNGTDFRLAPAMVHVDADAARVSIDCATTFPDSYEGTTFDPLETGNDPKFDFGELRLVVRDVAGKSHDFGPIPYTNTDSGDRCGWIFDFSSEGVADELIEHGNFCLHSPSHGDLLQETEYLIASDQSCIFGEQDPAGSRIDRFRSDGPSETAASVRVFRKGVELHANDTEIEVWSYATTPNQGVSERELVTRTFKPGDPLSADVKLPGNRLFTFTIAGQPEPPLTSDKLDLMLIPQVNLRILPNDKDYSAYYVDPTATPPVGNDKLTFEALYDEVLRNYYLLYPGMSLRVPLNDSEYWAGSEMAGRLMQRTQKSWWGKAEYMPRTRDLSDSRRTLIHAWCLKFLNPR